MDCLAEIENDFDNTCLFDGGPAVGVHILGGEFISMCEDCMQGEFI